MTAHPFSNGTERYAWQSVWCDHCALDHDMHSPDGDGGCTILAASFLDDYSESWLDVPDGYGHYLPSHMLCLKYEPCEDCGGDPHADTRADIVWQVTEAWRIVKAGGELDGPPERES